MTADDLKAALTAAHPKAIDFLEPDLVGVDVDSVAESVGYTVAGRRLGYVVFSTKEAA